MKKLFLLSVSALAVVLLPLALYAAGPQIGPGVVDPIHTQDEEFAGNLDIPQLSNFEVTVDVAVSDEIQVTLTPKGDPGFYLHVQIQPESTFTWCTGDEALCKAVGSGQSCDDASETGNWCYEDLEEASLPEHTHDPGPGGTFVPLF